MALLAECLSGRGVTLSSSCIGARRILWMSEITLPSPSLSDSSCRSLEWFTVSKNFDKSRSTIHTYPSFVAASASSIALWQLL